MRKDLQSSQRSSVTIRPALRSCRLHVYPQKKPYSTCEPQVAQVPSSMRPTPRNSVPAIELRNSEPGALQTDSRRHRGGSSNQCSVIACWPARCLQSLAQLSSASACAASGRVWYFPEGSEHIDGTACAPLLVQLPSPNPNPMRRRQYEHR